MNASVPTCGVHPPADLAPFVESWRTETVWALAHGIRADGAFDRMPILADALEDAGCDHLPLLNHCRHCDEHAAGCWALRVIVSGDDPRTAAHERWRISQAVAEAIWKGHPDDPDVVPGRRMPYPTAEERAAREALSLARAEKRGRTAMLAVRLFGVLILVIFVLSALKAAFHL